MRIVILGAGPAGLYLAYLIKRRQRDADVTVIEQNPADATFGFGVVFSDRALEFLRDDDEPTFSAITPHMESWSDIAIVHRGERVTIDGVGFAAIGRLKLLNLLQERAQSVGVRPSYRRAVKISMNWPVRTLSSAPTGSIRWCDAAMKKISVPA